MEIILSVEKIIQKKIQRTCRSKLRTMGLEKMFIDCSLKLLINHKVLKKANPIKIGSEGKSIPNEPISYSNENGIIAMKTKYNQVGWTVNIKVQIPNNGTNAIQYSFIQIANAKPRIWKIPIA